MLLAAHRYSVADWMVLLLQPDLHWKRRLCFDGCIRHLPRRKQLFITLT